jgi:hypothetical protein
MIEFALEAVECGYNYWGLINSYTRNQLTEQQIKDGSFISADNTQKDENGYTWKNMDKRIVGGWSGGGEPNSLSIQRFRSIAGCCVGTAPVGLWKVFDKTIEQKDDGLYINFPIARQSELATIETGYPNTGLLRVILHKPNNLFIRTYDWMNENFSLFVDGQAKPVIYKNGCVFIANQEPCAIIEIRHRLDERVTHDVVRGMQLHITWRGSDVVRIDPPGLPIMLYQREIGVPKIYPHSVGKTTQSVATVAPTDQKK